MIRLSACRGLLRLLLAAGFISTLSLQIQAAELPQNMGGNLRRLIVAKARRPDVKLNSVHLALDATTNTYELLPGKPNFVADQNNRVLLRVVLDGSLPAAQVGEAISKLGGTVTGTSNFGTGLLAAYVAVEQSADVARMPGVRAVHLGLRPRNNVGLVTAQDVIALQDDQVLAMGYSGKGITVGVMSDSFNTSGGPITALDDVNSGDLPDTKAIPGEEGLKAMIEDLPNGTDEGRAMAQIVHDMAPGAALCFATASNGEIDFAGNIRKLADPHGPCDADIIVDDVAYSDEPFFSDGLVSYAVDEVATSPKLDGRRVAYFSSAGNYQANVFASDFRPVSVAAAASQPDNPIDFSTVPATVDLSGGLHNFDSHGKIVAAQQLLVLGNPYQSFQWDDPFDRGLISTDYKLLLFDLTGKFIASSSDGNNASDTSNAFITDEPVKAIQFDTSGVGGQALYYLVIVRAPDGTKRAHRLKYVAFDGFLIAPYFGSNDTPASFGHATAQHAISVGAYEVNRAPYSADPPYKPELEPFTSPGPFLEVLDRGGYRLTEPQERKKPDVACTDDVFTTFFGNYVLPTDLFPRFAGTSAAAPCAAGVAAVMLEKARRKHGPGDLAPSDVREILAGTAPTRDVDAFYSQGLVSAGYGGKLKIQIQGNNNNLGDPSNVRIYFEDPCGFRLTHLSLHIKPSDELLFINSPNFPFSVGEHSPGVGVTLLNLVPPAGSSTGRSPEIDLAFTGFTSGRYAEFNADRANAIPGYLDDDADRLGGTTFTAEFTHPLGFKFKVNGVIENRRSKQWAPFDGFGLINAEEAIDAIP